jgi:hypothetical protein
MKTLKYNNLYHRITKNLNYSEHFILRLNERFNMNFYDLFKIIRSFVYHNGTKYCNNSLVINSKVSNGRYINADYLYSRKHDMILVFDRFNKTLITVEKYDTDYYYNPLRNRYN